MTERKLLELAPGSVWATNKVIDKHGDISEVVRCFAGALTLRSVGRDREYKPMYAQDAIAILHRAGLLDSLLADAWEQGVRDWIKGTCRDEYETASKQMIAEFCRAENPHRKATSDGE